MCSFFISAQQTPGPVQNQSILIQNATIHVGNGSVIENANLGFIGGKISYIGQENPTKKYDQIIKGEGKHIYPGLIALNTTLGLGEIDAVRATIDDDELGSFIPHVRSVIAYNAESKVVESMRMNGVLIAQIVPKGGTISGSSSVVNLDAWNWEDAAISIDQGVHLNWPSPYTRQRYSRGQSTTYKKNEKYQQSIEEIKNFFNSSRAYLKDPYPVSLPYQAMSKALNNEAKVYLHADDPQQIKDGVEFLKNQDIDGVVLVSAIYSSEIADFLAQNNIEIAVKQPHNLPSLEDEDPKIRFKLASELLKNKVLLSIDSTGEMSRMNTRNLPFFAGSFAAYGLTKEEALQSITLNAAKILAIDKNYGSLEIGKSATLFISSGDALDMRTNDVSQAFIDGRKVSLETHQTKLWKRYQKKVEEEKSN